MFDDAFAHPVTVGIVFGAAGVLAITPLILLALSAAGRLDAKLRRELWVRYLSWLVLAALMLLPVLAGRLPTIVAVGVLSLACFWEFGRATRLFEHKAISTVVALGIVLLTFAAADHWYGLFAALSPLVICGIAVVALWADQPQGYLHRVGLAVFAFLVIGVCLAHLGYFANDANFRPLVLMILVCVELNDVFAFIVGKTLGRRKLVPRTSPDKTVAGAAGALLLTTALFATLGHFVFAGTELDRWPHLLAMGFLLSFAGQCGDLVLSSIKRDLSIKDMGAAIPGHGGLLDRFDSLLLAAPALFHYINYFVGVALDQPTRVFTGE